MNDPAFIAEKIAEKEESRRDGAGLKNPERARRFKGRDAFRYLCYWGRPCKGGWEVRCTFESALYDLPTSFRWTNLDSDGLKKYVDALAAGRTVEARYFEEQGFADNHVYSTQDANKEPIRIGIKEFVDLMLLRGYIDLPADRRILFYTTKRNNQFVPSEFITAISRLPGLEHMRNKTEGWIQARREDFEAAGLDKPEKIHLGMGKYRPELSVGSAEVVEEPVVEDEDEDGSTVVRAKEPPAESEIFKRKYEKYFELVTSVKPQKKPAYFTRRLATYGGNLLWSGTSFRVDGPWTEYYRDSGSLLGLGIDP